MRYVLRIPTSEQYAYIEAEVEGTAEEALEHYYDLTFRVKAREGLNNGEWNRVVDFMFTENECNPDDIAAMNPTQQWFINECKKSFKRIKAREEREEEVDEAMEDVLRSELENK